MKIRKYYQLLYLTKYKVLSLTLMPYVRTSDNNIDGLRRNT